MKKVGKIVKQKFVSECTFCKEERQSAVCEDVRVGGGSSDCGTHLASTISARDVGSEHSPWLASPPASDTVSCISIKIQFILLQLLTQAASGLLCR